MITLRGNQSSENANCLVCKHGSGAHLNRSVRRERYPIPAVEQSLAQHAGAQVFPILDTNSGLWQIPRDRQNTLLTRFITPISRYCFHLLPFGITSAPEHFQ